MIRSLVGGSLLFPAHRLGACWPPTAAIAANLLHRRRVTRPARPRPPHFPAKAKRVIFLYMSGGVSHVDSFDHKPRLVADAGKTSPYPPRQERAS